MPHGDFLLPPFGPHQEKIGNVGAGNEQHHTDAAHEHPEDFSETADDVLFQRPAAGLEVGLFKQFRTESGRRLEFDQFKREHAADISICLLQAHAGLQAGDSSVAVIAQRSLGSIEAKQLEKVRLLIEQPEALGHYADDFAEPAINVNAA